MGNKKPQRITASWLRKIGVKEVLIPGILFAAIALKITDWQKLGPDIYKNKVVFPGTGIVRTIIDGDTLELQSGVRVRLIGIDAPERGQPNDSEATNKLATLVKDKRVWLEYDRYQDDQNGRVMAWLWVGCETSPQLTPSDYMHLSYNRSRPGIINNPKGCEKGQLVQEELVEAGFAQVEVYKDRGELKYEERLR